MTQAVRYVLLLIGGLALAFFLGLGGVPLFDLDEGAFSAATWEMLQRGDFITTYLNGEPRFDKPILIYWLQALSVTLVGVNEWGFRLPSALAATCWALSLYAFARPRLGREAALSAALMLAFAAVSWVIGRAATADALLNLLITLTLLDVYRVWERVAAMPTTAAEAVRLQRGLIVRVFFWMGLGFLTKGPVAIAIVLVVSGLFFLSTGTWRAWLRAVLHPWGWLVFLGVALPWYILEYQAQGQAFIDGFFLEHNIGRFTDTMEKHGGSLLYYFPVILVILLPFTSLFLRILPRLPALRDEPLDRFLWLWFGFVFVFFSFSSTQLPHYLLYGGSALLLLMARYRQDLQTRWLAYLPAFLVFALLLGLPDIAAWLGTLTDDTYVSAMLARSPAITDWRYYAWVTSGFCGLLVLALWPRLSPWRGLLAAGALQALVLSQAVVPWAAAVQQQPVVEAAQRATTLDKPVVMAGVNMPSFTVYRGAVTPRRSPEPGEVVFTRVHKLDRWPAAQLLYRAGGVALLALPEDIESPE